MKRFIFLLFILQACSSSEVTPHFNLENFRKKAEVILNEIPNWNISLVAERSKTETKGPYVSQEIQLAQQAWSYHFSDGDDVLFYINEMNYGSEGQAQEVFDMLRKKSKGGDELPGLTYTNDFLFTQGESIFWLNTACRYSWLNHTLLVKAFKSSIDIGIGKDTISCQCGFECD